MKFNLIDKENWSRKPYFDYYMNNIKCTYSMTANIENYGFTYENKKK